MNSPIRAVAKRPKVHMSVYSPQPGAKRPRQRISVSSAATATNHHPNRLFVEHVSPSALTPYPNGLRKHDEKHISACMGILSAVGLVVPIPVDEDNVIVDGHALVVAAERLGFPEIPIVRLSHLSPDLIKLVRVALNKLASGGRWDDNALKLELVEIEPTLHSHDIEIEAIGFTQAEFDLILSDPDEAEETEDDMVEAAKIAVTRDGDVWLLGGHRLLCGSALEAAAFVILMAGAKARMAFCDPPFNVKVDGHVSGLGKNKHREFAMASGEMSRSAFTDFLTGYMKNCAAHSVDGAIHFACMDWRHIVELVAAGEAAFQKFLNLIVWNKTNAGMGTMYRSQHELIGVFKSGTAPHKNNFGLGENGRHRSNVWTVAGANAFGKNRDADLADHPTVKPTILVMDAIRDVSDRGEIVLDCFCGSGTTILAAEKTGRRGFGMEIDPLYVDVAVRRWEKLTGKSAVLEGDGRTFAEVAADRIQVVEADNA